MMNAHILIVDDESRVTNALRRTLAYEGYQVSTAADGESALALVRTKAPDLIILDLGLPDKDGYGVLEELREWYTNPVIILSVQNNEENIIRALDNGANDYLSKPFRTGELLARIRRDRALAQVAVVAQPENRGPLCGGFCAPIIETSQQLVDTINETCR